MIRLSFPSIEEDDLQAVQTVLTSGYLVQGINVAAFEQAVADHVGVPYAIAVSNCTAALHLSLLALDIQPGDIVLLPAYSWIATANVVALCHAQPYFIDILPDTFNIDPEKLEDALTRLMSDASIAQKVKAVIPVHCFGQVADMPKLMNIAQKYNLPVVEDAACALGAELNGKQAGAWGATGCFSFHPRKAITTGEGGIITTSDRDIADRLRSLRNHGIDARKSKLDFIMPGFNYRLTDFQGALGVTQVGKLERVISARKRQASVYNELLRNSSFQLPLAREDNTHVFQSYVILIPEIKAGGRARLIDYMRHHGVETTIGTINMPMTSYYKSRYNLDNSCFPVTEDIAARSISLPLHEKILFEEQQVITKKLIEGIEKTS